jgi:AraC-like DNA-binding protein
MRITPQRENAACDTSSSRARITKAHRAERLQWHFSAGVLSKPCPNANPIIAKICQQVCDAVITETPGESELVRKICVACFNSPKRLPPAGEITGEVGLSLLTLHRRLGQDGPSYKSIVDGMRRSVAIELLENTHLRYEQIAERIGFADLVSFRKAFKNGRDVRRRFPRSRPATVENPLRRKATVAEK